MIKWKNKLLHNSNYYIFNQLSDEMTVGKLKALVKRIFKVSAQDITLTRIFKEVTQFKKKKIT